MKERPYLVIRNIFRKNNSDTKELMKFVIEKMDSISLWIIGLSVGTIAALASKITDITKLLTVGQTKCIFLLLFISVACGIVYRIIYVWLYILVDGGFRQIDTSLSEINIVDTEFDLDGTETFEDLVALNSQYQDLPNLLETYNNGSDTYKQQLYDSMVAFNKAETRIAKEELDLSLNTVEEAYKEALGIKIKLTNLTPTETKKPLRRMKILRVVCIALYLIFIATFLIAVGHLLYVVKLPIG